MVTERISRLHGRKLQQWTALMQSAGLEADTDTDSTVLLWEDRQLVAAGSRKGNLLKCIAVDPAHQGAGLLAVALTALRQDAFLSGYNHLFLYTKPENQQLFSSLFFYPIVRTDRVLLMEDKQGGIQNFLKEYPPQKGGDRIGAIVMNCDPFTLGHQYLIRTAAAQCDWLYVFVLSEDKGRFSAKDRMAMVRAGVAALQNVTVLPTGPYLISNATFPTYFLRDRDLAVQAHCQLDIEVFLKYFVPHFGITDRYVGTELLSALTRQYNEALASQLPKRGIAFHEIPRLEQKDAPISAGAIRKLLDEGRTEEAKALLPDSTLNYLKDRHLI
jgi:[citrate (pro-3S)-lyase] ligase